ncbi:ribosome biogenesis GTPase A [Novimethylophilus kurashikiensis]|uniref:Ribosome biogenesis GTPase A n=1 Tax=Novimethylophilus kurashikiensis TaxID=1825523 RepID=A0A2R5FC79_9PROT|nr:hypothetical protein [Novimethylophilus kurashikiensis]GBG14244.1 ribosome biogenesis GTPase A [Novimethylophilus kurashikiensis]
MGAFFSGLSKWMGNDGKWHLQNFSIMVLMSFLMAALTAVVMELSFILGRILILTAPAQFPTALVKSVAASTWTVYDLKESWVGTCTVYGFSIVVGLVTVTCFGMFVASVVELGKDKS